MNDLKNRRYLKSKFKDGDKPTQEDFADLIDSCLNQKSDKIFAVDRKVGIGTKQPSAPLEVKGAERGVRQSLLTSDGKNSNFYVAHPIKNVVALGGNLGTSLKLGSFNKECSLFQPKMTINTQGVGIGTKTTKAGLAVNGSAKISDTLYLGDGALEIKKGVLYLISGGQRYRVKLEKSHSWAPSKLLYWGLIIVGVSLLILILIGICLELLSTQ